jgi:hypothetical protein
VFSGKYEHRIFAGFGHNVPQEDVNGVSGLVGIAVTADISPEKDSFYLAILD